MYSRVFISCESKFLVNGYHLLVLAFVVAIMVYLEECVIQPNIVQFAFRIVFDFLFYNLLNCERFCTNFLVFQTSATS